MTADIATRNRTFTLVPIQRKDEKPRLFAGEPELLPIPRASEVSHVSTKTLIRLIKSHQLPGCKIGRSYFIPRDELAAYVMEGGGLDG